MLSLTQPLYARGSSYSYPFLVLQHLIRKYSKLMMKVDRNEVLVVREEGSDIFHASLRYVDVHPKIDKQLNFNRNVNEPINMFLRRIDASIYKVKSNKLKRYKKKCDENSTVSAINAGDNIETKMIKLVRNNADLDGNLSCKTMLEDSSNVKLIIFGEEYMIKQNMPYVEEISLSSTILVGFPTYPTTFISAFVDIEKSTFNWYKQVDTKFIHVGEGYVYTPKVSDMGYHLKIECLPRNNDQVGGTIEIQSNNVVEPGPGPCPFEIRHRFTQSKLSGESFRVTTYNILANIYSETEMSKDTLYPYCPLYALSMDYRKLLIMKELIGYNSDIICLQEVDQKVYNKDLVLALHTLNYDSLYNPKLDNREGVAIFYNKDRFDILDCCCSVMSQGTDLKEFNSVWLQIKNEHTKQTFLNRNTIIQAVALRCKENSEVLIVGNTHLFFLPQASHIRLLQAYYGLVYLQAFAKEIKINNPECNVNIIYCGDFNSTPESGVYQLMTQKYISEDNADWKSSPEQPAENVNLKHNTNLSSACGTPEYTNYIGSFSGCLDYIFYQTDNLKIEQVVPIPSIEEVSLYTGLPSVVFPSDHISLCADLKWIK